jgi:polysaccharide pyruvyl transferase WcaK-like protein
MKQIRIIIVGYYNHDNLGDEQYKETFEYMLDKYLSLKKNYEILFVDCDSIHNIPILKTDVIILGGGDILNFYFIDKIHSVFHNKPNKILAVSVGLPYSDILIHTNKLNIIDYIFIRTKKDIKLFSKYFLKERIIYLPDISFYVTRTISSKKYYTNHLLSPSRKNTVSVFDGSHEEKRYEYIINKIKTQDKKIISFSLCRHIYNKNNPEYYQNIIQELATFICYLSNSGYFIILLPFNTSNHIVNREDNLENDIYIHEDICDMIPSSVRTNILNIKCSLNSREVLKIYEYVYISIPMRFHACLFSTYRRIPILPLFTQKKIRNLLLDIDWKHYYELPKNEKDVPISICQLQLQEKFHTLVENFHNCRELLNTMCMDFEQNLQKSVPELMNVIQTPYNKIKTVVNQADNRILELYNKLQKIASERGYSDFRSIDNLELKEKIVSVVNFFITGDFVSCYSFGLMEKMFVLSFNYNDEWKWILHDWQEKHADQNEKYSNPNGLFNLHYIPQADKSGAHRSGWQFVYTEIEKLHNENSDLYLDLYLDRTFHWKKDILKMVDILPYRNPWIGFIHHTFDQTFSTYNNVVMFQDPDFITSLDYCKGIFVLSDYLKTQIEDIFTQQKINIPVYTLMHPTETQNIPEFTIQKFTDNTDKKIVHVGGWLRNIFTFYKLDIPKQISHSSSYYDYFLSFIHKNNNKTQMNIRKVALKGKGMNNYYPTDDLLPLSIDTQNVSEINKNCSQNKNESKNNWYKHLHQYLQSIYNSVEIIQSLTNSEYDDLLSNNIVFIHLVDASTVNTILECIVRNTPIIVNKHPAVVELLGEDYPLYYDENLGEYDKTKEIRKLINMKKIGNAYNYLKRKSKEEYETQYMITKFKEYLSI